MLRKSIWRPAACALVLAMTLAACGDDAAEPAAEGDSAEAPEGEAAADAPEGDPTPIRFLIAPDPLWDYMVEEGMVGEYERKYNIEIRATSSWDEFTFFAGGHGDIVSLGTHELPILEEETGIDTITFGRYNSNRSAPATSCDNDWETVEDAVADGVERFGTNSAVSTTVLWDVYLREMEGIPFEVGNPEMPFELFVEDHFVLGELLRSGDLDAAVVIPEAIIDGIESGEICQMYEGRPSWQIIRGLMDDPDHKGVLSNGFTSTKEFYDENPEAVAAFLALWEAGLQAWDENFEEIVRRYPQHFTVDTEEGIQWMIDYFESDKDYFADTVYLDEEWIENESALFPLLQEHGRMNPDAEIPEYAVVEPLE